MPSHIFEVGQTVVMTGWSKTTTSPQETYRIVATLPETNNRFQYRIRSDNERHERVAAEDSLATAETPQFWAAK
jgi:hypothetical protein